MKTPGGIELHDIDINRYEDADRTVQIDAYKDPQYGLIIEVTYLPTGKTKECDSFAVAFEYIDRWSGTHDDRG